MTFYPWRAFPKAAEVRRFPVATRPDRKLTYEDYVHFPEGERYELIDGEAWMVPAPNTRHQDIAGSVYVLARNFLDVHGGGRVFIAPFDVVLDPGDVLQPDVVFIADNDMEVLTEANVWGTPTWVVEVFSQDVRRDRVLKLQRYERFGVPEVWLIDPRKDTLEIHRLADGAYGEPAVVRPPEIARPLVPTDLAIDLTYVFRR